MGKSPFCGSPSDLGNTVCLLFGDILLKALQGCASAFRRMIEMEISAFLSLPEGMIVEQVQMTQTQLTVVALSLTRPFAHICSYSR
jgi:hypothetical protein